MRQWIRVMLVVLIVSAYASSAFASEKTLEDLENAVPDEARPFLETITGYDWTDISEGLQTILMQAADQAVSSARDAVLTAFRLLLILLLCQILHLFCEGRYDIYIRCGGTVALAVPCLNHLRTMVETGTEMMGQLSDFIMVLNPVLASAAAASGISAGAAANYALTAFFFNILMRASSGLVYPGVYTYVLLAMSDSIAAQERLKRMRELLGTVIEWLMKGTVYVFCGCLTFTGVLAGSVDGAKLKAAKAALSAMIPVVGGIVSGAAQTVLSGAEVLKSIAGTYGMFAILAIFLLPFVKLLALWFCVRLAAVFGSLLLSPLTGFLEAVGKAMGYILGLTGSSTIVCLLSCCCYLKVVRF